MPEDEEKLTGGNVAESVVRLGATVRKPATMASPAVHAFLRHLHSKGYSGSPQVFGIDEQGRQILEFIPGAAGHGGDRSTLTDLRRIGLLIRELHDAAASFQSPTGATWDSFSSPDGNEIICHNDLAPWNLVRGTDRWAFIDWDNAAPGTRLWDLALATISFPPVEPDCDLYAAAESIHALASGYGLEPSGYGNLLTQMTRRARASSDLLTDGARTGQQPWARLYAEGHDRYWGPVSNYIGRHASVLNGLLLSFGRAGS